MSIATEFSIIQVNVEYEDGQSRLK